jgi:hypothetical protein
LRPTLWSGYVSWLFLMVGLISLLRAAGRGRTGWEPTALVVVACLPPVWLCIEMYAHPQDLVAMGFSLLAMACALRAQWIGAGIWVALAVLSQPFGLLVAIPLFVVAPAVRKLPFVSTALASVAVVALPLIWLSSGSATHTIFLGSGNAVTVGTTVLWKLHLSKPALVQISRIAPLIIALVLAWLVQRRLGAAVLEPPALISLIVSFSLRLIFEDNHLAYYFMALTVTLVVLDVVHGRIRASLVAWVALITVINSESITMQWRRSWGMDAGHWIPLIIVIVGLVWIVCDVLRHAAGWHLLIWATSVIAALIVWPESSDPLSYQFSPWVWQVVLVATGVALAAGPLVHLLRQHSQQQFVDERV